MTYLGVNTGIIQRPVWAASITARTHRKILCLITDVSPNIERELMKVVAPKPQKIMRSSSVNEAGVKNGKSQVT